MLDSEVAVEAIEKLKQCGFEHNIYPSLPSTQAVFPWEARDGTSKVVAQCLDDSKHLCTSVTSS